MCCLPWTWNSKWSCIKLLFVDFHFVPGCFVVSGVCGVFSFLLLKMSTQALYRLTFNLLQSTVWRLAVSREFMLFYFYTLMFVSEKCPATDFVRGCSWFWFCGVDTFDSLSLHVYLSFFLSVYQPVSVCTMFSVTFF